MGIGATIIENDRLITPVKTTAKSMEKLVASDSFKIVLEELSISREQYLKTSRKMDGSDFVYIRHLRQLIDTKPILREGYVYYCYDPMTILERTTRLFKEHVREFLASNGALNAFMNQYGHLFKAYIGLILAEIFGREKVIDCDSISGFAGSKADWIVTGEHHILIFECKASPINNLLKVTGSIELLDSWISGVFEAGKQLGSTEQQLDEIDTSYNSTKKRHEVLNFVVQEEHFEMANEAVQFRADTENARELLSNKITVLSAYDLEILTSSNYRSQGESALAYPHDKSQRRRSLETRIRSLPGFDLTHDSFLDEIKRQILPSVE